MIAPVHKNTNAPLILIVCDVIFCMLAKHIIGEFSRLFEAASTFMAQNCSSLRSGQFGVQRSLGHLEKLLEIADYGFCPHKK